MVALIGSSALSLYLGIFFILLLCGLGLPIPEDIFLITAGYLTYINSLNIIWMCIFCLIGVLMGDLTIFLIGRRFGQDVTRLRWLSKIWTPHRLTKTQTFFHRYGNKAIFLCRFLPGLRSPTYLLAGAMKFKPSLFLLLDGLAALLSVPLIVYLAFHFGDDIESAKHQIRTGIYWVAGLIILYIFLEMWRNRKKSSS